MYGMLPKVVETIDISPKEMMFWMYLPISVPGDHSMMLPDNLKQFLPIIRAARWDDHELWVNSYVYLTAKTLWVSGDYIGNRPGWHSDGFGTEDINYIWCDRAPTDFMLLDTPRELPADCVSSMRTMVDWHHFPLRYGSTVHQYPDKTLLRLDQSVIHRSPLDFEAGMRTFVKLSLSKDRYNLEGNSINHELYLEWNRVPRMIERNHPYVAIS